MNRPSVSAAALHLFRRDLLLAYRRRGEIVLPPLFFVLVVTLFALGVGAQSRLLHDMAPGVIWVAALLAAIISMDQVFRSDFEDGSLEQLLLSGQPLSLLVLSKVAAHWLVTGMPLLMTAPLLGAALDLAPTTIAVLMLTLLLGTPVLSLVGAIAVALTVGLRKGGVLLTLLVVPLYVPVLVFATGAVTAAASEVPVTAQLSMLAAILIATVTLAPVAVAAALRVSLE